MNTLHSKNRKKNPCCPIDNKQLSENDLFPDNYTRREIQQIRKSCPNAELGCKVIMSPLELDDHVMQCTYQHSDAGQQHECIFKAAGCLFHSIELDEMNIHQANEMTSHLNVTMLKFYKLFIRIIRYGFSISCSWLHSPLRILHRST